MKILQLIHTAYRATTEEQDDTIVWLTHAMTGAGGDFDVLLSGNAVNYTVVGQNAAGLRFGEWRQTQPPSIERDIRSLIAKDVDVYFVEEDARALALESAVQIEDVRAIALKDVAGLIEGYDQVWRW